jgi:hypothetical protein
MHDLVSKLEALEDGDEAVVGVPIIYTVTWNKNSTEETCPCTPAELNTEETCTCRTELSLANVPYTKNDIEWVSEIEAGYLYTSYPYDFTIDRDVPTGYENYYYTSAPVSYNTGYMK